jgi:uncharacterized protein (DUF2252 family)
MGTAASGAGRETVAERRERGRALRKQVPRSSHEEWAPGPDRPDPVDLVEEQNADRLDWLVPVRRGRMSVSAFTFYRAAARIMATDLATTPVTGLAVQTCGDAHLSNFGAFASPERRLVFDLNDFDETLPGPWEWDLKRLAASFVIAGRDRGFEPKDSRAAAERAVAGYRDAMRHFSSVGTLDLWYSHLEVDRIATAVTGKAAKRLDKFTRKAKSKDSLRELSKLTETVDGTPRIKSDPPVLVPLREIAGRYHPEALREAAEASFASYRASLANNRKRLLDRFEVVDMALKVVGVGSVGTRCLILLLVGRDAEDPLFLQIKEASASVLEEHLPASAYRNHGARVVWGQRLMQATSDIFLGWSKRSADGHDFYWRQLKDWKGSADLEKASPPGLARYADICGWTLARAHARSGDSVAIAGYVGSGDVLVRSIADFAEAYADQNDADYAAFMSAIDERGLQVVTGE